MCNIKSSSSSKSCSSKEARNTQRCSNPFVVAANDGRSHTPTRLITEIDLRSSPPCFLMAADVDGVEALRLTIVLSKLPTLLSHLQPQRFSPRNDENQRRSSLFTRHRR